LSQNAIHFLLGHLQCIRHTTRIVLSSRFVSSGEAIAPVLFGSTPDTPTSAPSFDCNLPVFKLSRCQLPLCLLQRFQ
jgi:hypothetical protein